MPGHRRLIATAEGKPRVAGQPAMPRIVYHRRYNLGFPGAQRMHPFDLRKYARAWRVLRGELGPRLNELHLSVAAPVGDDPLRLVHTADYLASLRQSGVVAQAIEVPALRRAPWWLLERFVLEPMRWAAAGTILAGRAALIDGLVFNLGGGFHHARPDRGEGFSIYNDIAVMIAVLRHEGHLAADSRIACIDLDAHLGNGVAWCFWDDPRVFLFDMHNGSIYPVHDAPARERVDCLVPLAPGTGGAEYHRLLRERLPGFLDSICRTAPLALAVYNAGTDVLAGDPLGGLELSLDDCLARDLYVLQLLRQRGVPTVMLTSGGYTAQSYQAIARTLLAAV
jgi:histone deacetylase 11